MIAMILHALGFRPVSVQHSEVNGAQRTCVLYRSSFGGLFCRTLKGHWAVEDVAQPEPESEPEVEEPVSFQDVRADLASRVSSWSQACICASGILDQPHDHRGEICGGVERCACGCWIEPLYVRSRPLQSPWGDA